MRFVEGFRIVTTRVVAVLGVFLIIFCDYAWMKNGVAETSLELVGVFLIVIGITGRLWCSVYIAGYKYTTLIQEGPYSMTRNPLYFFSFLAIVGLALTTKMFTLALIVALIFAFYYPYVILGEERKLLKLHGEPFADYCRRVPRFWPRLSQLSEPEHYSVNTKLLRRTFNDGMGFMLFYAFIRIMEKVHAAGWVPVWAHLY